jgi:hypothetical protein
MYTFQKNELVKFPPAKKILSLWLSMAWPVAVAFCQSPSSQQSQPSQQAQSQPQPPPKEESVADAAKKQKDKPKVKKVLTEDDLSGKSGGVSVVGDSNAGAAGKKDATGKDNNSVIPMSGQDEAYWRGKAQPILDAIAATDQEIAKTKEDIKKYGGDGFDVTSGLKQDIIYIDNRNARVQQLEKRKANLQAQLDALQEEGRKAGASPAWFR